MAVVSTFKQQCPSCEAMITVKENMIGKKIECTKCKDKFIAEKPEEEDELEVDLEVEVEEESPAKKNTKSAGKKKTEAKTAVTTKAPAGKRPKVEVAEEEEEEEENEDDEEETGIQVKPSKNKAATNGKSNGKLKKTDEEDDEEENEDDEEAEGPIKKKNKAGSNKLMIGLGLAAVGVVVLVVAGFFLLRKPPQPVNPGNPNQGGDQAKGDGVLPPPPPPPKIEAKGNDLVAVPLNDAELARLSNLLPGDTEHVFRVAFRDVFAPNSPMRNAVFGNPEEPDLRRRQGALDDDDLRKRIGFSVLAIDDFIIAEKNTTPNWSFTVIHFKEVLNEKELRTALKLESAGQPIEGQSYFKLTKVNPAFEQLARFAIGIPNFYRYFEAQRGERLSYVRLHNPQTLIVSDLMPMQAFLKVKGQFPLQTTRQPAGPDPKNPMPPAPGGMGGGGPMPPPPPAKGTFLTPEEGRPEFVAFFQQPNPASGAGTLLLGGTKWEGGETVANSKLAFSFVDENSVVIDMARADLKGAKANWKATGPDSGKITSPALGDTSYEFVVDGAGTMKGKGKSLNTWDFELKLTAGAQPKIDNQDPKPKDPPPPDPKDPKDPKDPPGQNPNAGREDMYLTIKPILKAMLDKVESRGSDKDKVLFSSATDMNANTLDPDKTGIKDAVIRMPRQFWDVTLLLSERKPRIRFLGTALVQRGGETLKYQLRNELSCAQEIDAKEFQQEMLDRTAYQVGKFISQIAKHDVKLPSSPKKNPVLIPAPPPEGGDPKLEDKDKKPTEALVSQISVKQEANTIEFILDLLLDNQTFTQTLGITTLTAAALRVEIDAAASLSLRHNLAGAGKLVGEKGLPERQVAPGRFPPGAFPRTNARLFVDREPKNRISWMAALLPYMGHKNLHDRIRFDQSWRDSSNWMVGHTVVPQFLDPRYPEFTRQASIGELPLDFAATHYVGIAGVGLDAASYLRSDPATAHKRGVLNYDNSATLQEVSDGRGTANTILMIQIPYDTGTGVSPWIAGGGATLRGVPEKDSIAPFVLGADRTGQTIQHPTVKGTGAKGTYAVMTDGSVRFISENVSDEVFKAMCTIGGPVPNDFNLKQNSNTPLVPPPPGMEPSKAQDKKPPVKVEPKKEPAQKEPEKTPAVISPADDLKALQGVWLGVSGELNGQKLPQQLLQFFRITVNGDKLSMRINAEREDTFTFRIDPGKTPKHLDKTKVGDASIRDVGIYELNGDVLRICNSFAEKNQVRPATFATQPGADLASYVFRRQKQ